MGPPLKAAENTPHDRSAEIEATALQWGRR